MRVIKFLSPLLFSLAGLLLSAQNDSAYHIALILPFESENTIALFNDFNSAKDLYTASRIRIPDETQIALDFYQGLLQAINESKDSLKIKLNVYDCEGSDSVTSLLLKNTPELKKQDIIIGSVSTPESKLIADFCKKNKIINIQPFTPSKSLGADNPYHLKLAPTIDSHADALFNSIVDSFPGANIIIYTPDAENSVAVGHRLDSLFKDYNQTASPKFTVELLNANDMLLNGVKTTAAAQLQTGKPNIIVMTSFEESFVNGNLRVLFNERSKYNIIVYGMPNWLNGDILRLDYLNDYNTRISDGFYIDSTKAGVTVFSLNYKASYGNEPTRYSYLGYDVMGFVYRALTTYGKNFLDDICTQRYTGLAYKFDISKNKNNDGSINYYENRHVNVFKIQDYRLKKDW